MSSARRRQTRSRRFDGVPPERNNELRALQRAHRRAHRGIRVFSLALGRLGREAERTAASFRGVTWAWERAMDGLGYEPRVQAFTGAEWAKVQRFGLDGPE